MREGSKKSLNYSALLSFVFVRPIAWLGPFLGIAFGGLASKASLLEILLCAIAFGPFLLGFGQTINQIYDIEIDRINKPDRPLASGKVSLRTAWIITLILLILGLTLCFMLSFYTGLFGLWFAFMMFIYSVPPFRAKGRNFAIAYASITTSYAFISTMAAWTINMQVIPPQVVIIAVLYTLLIFGQYCIKDFDDIEGDRKYGISTLPIVLGVKKSALIIVLTGVFVGIGFLLLPLLGMVRFEMLPLIILGSAGEVATTIYIYLDPIKRGWKSLRYFLLSTLITLTGCALGLIY